MQVTHSRDLRDQLAVRRGQTKDLNNATPSGGKPRALSEQRSEQARMKTSAEIAYQNMSAAQNYERSLAKPMHIPRRGPSVEFVEEPLTWGDKVSLVPRYRPKFSDNVATALHADSRSPPNFARGSHDVQGKDSALVPRVEEHDLLMRHLGHTRSSDRAPQARIDLW